MYTVIHIILLKFYLLHVQYIKTSHSGKPPQVFMKKLLAYNLLGNVTVFGLRILKFQKVCYYEFKTGKYIEEIFVKTICLLIYDIF